MMTKRLFSLFCFVGVVAFLVASCQAPALEEIQVPEEPETEVVPEWTTIPYSLSVSTEKTRVATNQNATEYQFKEGDKIRITGTGDRTDINGLLEPNETMTVWTGTISYLTDKGPLVSGTTGLKASVIHADNSDASTYATALVGTGSGDGWVSEAQLLQYAVEHYSLFSATYTYDTSSSDSVELTQQATFLDCTITFIFDGTHDVGGGGNAKVDLITTQGEMWTDSAFSRVDDEHYKVHFMAVIPGDQAKNAFTLTVADRAITFSNSNNSPTTLASNKVYTVKRDIVFGPQLGDPFWSDGTYGRMDHPSTDAKIVGIIVYANRGFPEGTAEAIIDDAITEKADGYGHGLVMALRNAGSYVKWGNKGSHLTDNYVETPAQTLDAGRLSGYNNTKSIGSQGDAASMAAAYNEYVVINDPNDPTKKVTTGWFLPSIGQWIYTISIDGFGGADHAENWTDNTDSAPKKWLDMDSGGLTSCLIRVLNNNDQNENNLLVKSLNDRLDQLWNDFHVKYPFEYDSFGIPVGARNISDNYWTSSEYNTNQAIRMNLGSVEWSKKEKTYYSTIKAKPEDKTSTNFSFGGNDYPAKVRPFLAF